MTSVTPMASLKRAVSDASASSSTFGSATYRVHPRSPAFKRRRAGNWLILGLTYSAMYTGRYNLSLVNPILSKNYNWDKTEIGGIISPALLAYGIFAIFNGMVADRLGGRRSFLIGAIGAAVCNFLFGLGAYLGLLGNGSLLLGYFATIWMLNSYFQSFGAVSMVKINSAWFEREERGVFSAIFGSMIQMGRTLIFVICPLLLLFFSWEWLFFLPSLFILGTAILSFLFVQDDPQKCGFSGVKTQEIDPAERRAQFKWVFNRIFKNPVTLSIALAEFCTGFVRQGFEQWFPRYLIEVQNLPFDSPVFQQSALAIVISSIFGFVLSGTLSDWVFKGRRMPVALLAYVAQILALCVVWKVTDPMYVTIAFMVNSCAISMVHGMLSGTAAADFGGPKAAATAAGLFDGMEYIGGSFVGIGMGWMLERFGWSIWGPSMIGFSVVGAVLMLVFRNAKPIEGT